MLQENSDEQWIRLSGGVQSLIDALAETILQDIIELETRVKKIQLDETGDITVETKLSDGRRKKFLQMLLF
ncbi:FAD-dependent oxidoreductase [Neobacillus drentensis]|uniref:FAD-dependent oxidoreductase n=1 Tax=Neobacillus drentensis TaxID=220684 RepID=UPI001F1C422D|nr:FAD-dependent oxidoreductase [Neobacillus drentensis]ULT54832.1 FAD-dependent oxidoreductase [Neobacillus drentensis]